MSEDKTPVDHQARSGPTIGKVAWTTISVFILLTLALVAAAFFGARATIQEVERIKEIPPPPVFEAPEGMIETWTLEAAEAAAAAVSSRLDETLEAVFGPVHDAVPEYADFHYSVIGEYVELTEAATQSVSTSMQERLFEGFDDRLGSALRDLGEVYSAAFERSIEMQVEADRAAFNEDGVVGSITRAVVDDAVARFSTSLPADIVAAGAGVIGAKAVATALGKATIRSVAKVAGKAAAKPLGVGGTAATGAMIGTALGPVGTVLGGVGGAALGWLAMDYAVVKVDELISRDAFEANLHVLIDAEKNALRSRIEKAVSGRALGSSGTIREIRGSGSPD